MTNNLGYLKYDENSGLCKNFDCHSSSSIAKHKLEEFLVSEHLFKTLDQYEANVAFKRCHLCHVSDTWSKLVYVTLTN